MRILLTTTVFLPRIGGIEIRQYGPRVIARTRMSGEQESERAKNDAFRVLAGYIFGGNDGGQSIAMTTPVTTQTESAGTRIAMTTPVETRTDAAGEYMTFTMPSEFSMEELPTPSDPRVELLEAPGQRVASLRFSGRARASDVSRRTDALLAALRSAGLSTCGEPYLAQYDPPWVLGVFRRNEVHVPVEC